jgi:hypothetical protein
LWKVVQAPDYGKEQVISFSKFMQDVGGGKVSDVTLTGNEVHGRYKDGTPGFHTTSPANYSDMVRDLRDKGVNIQVKDNASSASNFLLNLSPLLLFAALWFFMVRQMQRSSKAKQSWRSATEPPPLSELAMGGESQKQSPRLVLANSQGTLAFGHCRSQNREITFYPESQIGPVVAWMLAPTPPADLLGPGK